MNWFKKLFNKQFTTKQSKGGVGSANSTRPNDTNMYVYASGDSKTENCQDHSSPVDSGCSGGGD